MRTGLVCLCLSIASIIMTIALFFRVAIIHDALLRRRGVPAAFSEFLAEVDQGHVEEIRVDGSVYTFRVHSNVSGRTFTKWTVGPRVTLQELRTLRPADPSLPAPDVGLR